MKFKLNERNLSRTAAERNALACIAGLSLVANILLGIVQLSKSERIIISPPDCSSSYWVEGNRFSPSYLIEHARYYTAILLDTSASKFDSQADIILRNSTKENNSDLQVLLIETSQQLRKSNMSTGFEIKDYKVAQDGLTVIMTGSFSTYAEGKKVTCEQKTFSMKFKNNGGKLLISAFCEEKERDDEN